MCCGGEMYRKLQMFNDWYPLLVIYKIRQRRRWRRQQHTTTRQRICVYKNMHNTLYIDLQKWFYIGFLCVSTKPTKKSKFVFLTISRFQYFQYFSIWNKASRSNLNLYQKCTKFFLVLLLFTIFVRMYTYTIFVCNLQVFRWRFKTILYTYVGEGLIIQSECISSFAGSNKRFLSNITKVTLHLISLSVQLRKHNVDFKSYLYIYIYHTLRWASKRKSVSDNFEKKLVYFDGYSFKIQSLSEGLTWLTGSFSWRPTHRSTCLSSVGGRQLICIKL